MLILLIVVLEIRHEVGSPKNNIQTIADFTQVHCLLVALAVLHDIYIISFILEIPII